MLLAAVLCASCARSSKVQIERIAFLPFDNLTADPALDWMASAAPAIIAEQLTGATGVTPVRAQSLDEAYAEKATRFVHGYFDHRAGALHFELSIEDATSHKMVQTNTLVGDLLPAMNTAARAIDPTARSFSTSNPDAVTAWGKGDYQRAVQLDPEFSEAWLTWVQSRIAERDNQGALKIAQDALTHPLTNSPVDRAQLELLSSTLAGDQDAREKALTTLRRLVPDDPGVLRTLADLEMNARRFPQAVTLYQQLQRLDPDDIAVFNLLGYAQAYARDVDGAQKSFEQYGRQPGQEANALDSAGEAMFLNGRFADAEKYFLQANAKESNGGIELLKAAYARWLQGDLAKADELFGQYQAVRTQASDPLLFWREAVWQYSTGRPEQAIMLLEKGNATGATADLVQKQLAIWRNPQSLPNDPAALKPIYESTTPTSDGLIRTLYAAALLRTGQTEEAKKLIELWPIPEAPGDDLLRSFVYPKFLELKQKLK